MDEVLEMTLYAIVTIYVVVFAFLVILPGIELLAEYYLYKTDEYWRNTH